MKVITGLDLPVGSPGGSVELLKDLYLGPRPPVPAEVFMLEGPPGAVPGGPVLLDVPGKQLAGPGFWAYVDDLAAALRKSFVPGAEGVLHLQHLAFGATPALLRAFPGTPALALVHGTDLLFAADHPTQLDVLREAAAAARRIVVPTGAMADRLRELTPVAPDRIVPIPWGVPDHLLRTPPARTPRGDGPLRVLYAGRLTTEKADAELLARLAAVPGAALSVAAPRAEYQALTALADLTGVRYLGWLDRPRLWQAFAEHDVLVVPSNRLEAFGLVAVEAQACGLPVLYRPVPGLAEVLGGSALATPAADGRPAAFTTALGELVRDPTALTDLRTAGLRNAARFPLSRTARDLRALSDRLD